MNFLSKKKGAHNVPLLELETIAILFSLPYALLMWRWVIFFFHLLCYCAPVLFFSHPHISMVTFVVAFLHLWFENSNIITLSSMGLWLESLQPSLCGAFGGSGRNIRSLMFSRVRNYFLLKKMMTRKEGRRGSLSRWLCQNLLKNPSHQSWTLNSLCHSNGPPSCTVGVSQTMLKNLNIVFI